MSVSRYKFSPYSFILIVFLLLNSELALAEKIYERPGASSKFWISTGFRSYHSNRQANYNETNTGIGIEYHINDENILALGHYENSIRKQTTYLNYAYTPLKIGNIRIGGAIGIVNGYPLLRNGKFAPVLMPVASTNFRVFDRNVGINTVYIPSIIPNVDGALAFQLKFALD